MKCPRWGGNSDKEPLGVSLVRDPRTLCAETHEVRRNQLGPFRQARRIVRRSASAVDMAKTRNSGIGLSSGSITDCR
jgi:hypothetical protein